MFEIDHYAHTGRLTNISPALKVGCGLAVLTVAVSMDSSMLHALLLLFMAALSVGWAGVPLRPYLRLYAIPASFTALSLLTIALTVTRSPALD